jgi:hypothetical protein
MSETGLNLQRKGTNLCFVLNVRHKHCSLCATSYGLGCRFV